MPQKKTIKELVNGISREMTQEEKDEQLAGMMWGNLLENEEVMIEQCRNTVQRMRSEQTTKDTNIIISQ